MTGKKRARFGKCYKHPKKRRRTICSGRYSQRQSDGLEKKDEGHNISERVIYDAAADSEHKSPLLRASGNQFFSIGCCFIYGPPLGINHQQL